MCSTPVQRIPTAVNINHFHLTGDARAFFFSLGVCWRFANQPGAYCHLLYGSGYIRKCAWAQNGVTDVKADSRRRSEREAITVGHGTK